MSSSGHWESGGSNNNTAPNKKYYCTVSGGYAFVGARILDPKEGLQFVEFDKCTIEDFNKSTVKNYVKQVSNRYKFQTYLF